MPVFDAMMQLVLSWTNEPLFRVAKAEPNMRVS